MYANIHLRKTLTMKIVYCLVILLISSTTLAQSHLLALGVNVVENFNRHVKVDNEVVKLLHDAYTMLFHDVIFTGQLRPNRLA